MLHLLLLVDEAGHAVGAGDQSTLAVQGGVLLQAALQHRLLAVGAKHGGQGTLAHVVLEDAWTTGQLSDSTRFTP